MARNRNRRAKPKAVDEIPPLETVLAFAGLDKVPGLAALANADSQSRMIFFRMLLEKLLPMIKLQARAAVTGDDARSRLADAFLRLTNAETARHAQDEAAGIFRNADGDPIAPDTEEYQLLAARRELDDRLDRLRNGIVEHAEPAAAIAAPAATEEIPIPANFRQVGTIDTPPSPEPERARPNLDNGSHPASPGSPPDNLGPISKGGQSTDQKIAAGRIKPLTPEEARAKAMAPSFPPPRQEHCQKQSCSFPNCNCSTSLFYSNGGGGGAICAPWVAGVK